MSARLFLLLLLPFSLGPRAGLSDEANPVVRIQPWRTDTGRAAWSPRGDLIAFDEAGDDGYSNLYLVRPDGTMEDCLTCERLDFRKRHAGDPVWHPSGRLLVFQVSKPFVEAGRPYPFLAVPGRNLGNDLWIVNLEARTFWRLTNLGERGGRVSSAAFSREGDRLAWSERVASGGTWGSWALRVGRFEHSSRSIRTKGIRTLEPGHRQSFYELYGFSADDRSLLIAGTLTPDQPIHGMDLHQVPIHDGEARALTSSNGSWDRFGALAPNGRWVVWSSSRDIPTRTTGIERRDRSSATPLDLWWMREDGSEAVRLTRFNDVMSEHYSGLVMVGPTSWSPAGDRLLTLVTPVQSSGVEDQGRGTLFLLELDQPYGR